MHSHENKTQQKNSHAVGNELSDQQNHPAQSNIIDSRPETVKQANFQSIANHSKQVRQLQSLQASVNNYVIQQRPVVQLNPAEERAQEDARQILENINLIARKLTVFQRQEINDRAREFSEAASTIMSTGESFVIKCRQLAIKQDEIRHFITAAKKIDNEEPVLADTAGRVKLSNEKIAEAFEVLDTWKL